MAGEEFAQVNPTEVKAKQVKAEFDAVWNSEVTAENIRSFSDDCLDKVAEIVTQVTKERFPGEEITQEKEDIAFRELGLDVVGTLNQLQTVIGQKDLEIKSIFQYVINVVKTNTVIIPPSDKRFPQKMTGDTTEKQPETFKAEMTIYILTHDFGIPFEEINIFEGEVLKDMVRKTPYIRIEALGKVIYVCNEPLNNTFVFDLASLPEGIDVEQLDNMNKGELEELVYNHPSKNYIIKFASKWGENLFQAISGTKKIRIRKDLTEINPKHLPVVINDVNNPYYGFAFIDGEYWGTVSRFQTELGMRQNRVEELVEGLPIKKIFFLVERDAYPLVGVKKRLNLEEFPVGKMLKGEWAHFALLDGKHYAKVTSIAKKLGINRTSLQEIIRRDKITPVNIFMFSQTQAYCYEDFLARIEVIKTLPLVEYNERYKANLWVDADGKHWGTFTVISQLANVNIVTVLKRSTRKIDIRVSELRIARGYCLEDFGDSFKQKQLRP